jgi:hypothetical protein
MGSKASKSNLYLAVSAADVVSITAILTTKPDFLDEPLTDDRKSTALTRAVYLRKHHIVKLLLERGADPNKTGANGISAIMWAASKDDVPLINILVEAGGRIEQTGPHQMNALDFAVIYGNYETAFSLKQRGLSVNKSPEEFAVIKGEWATPYVDYPCFLMSLDCNMPPEGAPKFTIPPPPKIEILEDPVSDPREKWSAWMHRVLEFEYAPKVERNSLPEELQPQNTKLGRVKTFLGLENSPPEEHGR